ncbi:MAG: alpha/beta hydrolase family protein [Deltaproteobacteria bacterium]|nr:alpha/beta hydrolase family protein [Deltaproteobacteria bacterium]
MTGTRHHWLDRFFAVALSRPRMFVDGWGDSEVLRRAAEDPDPLGEREGPLVVRWGDPEPLGRLWARTGAFESPIPSPPLPAAVRPAHALWVTATRDPGPRPTWVVLAASGEAGFKRRLQLVGPVVAEGAGAVLLENPYYGLRRPAGQRGTKVRTVADQLLMNLATIREALALVDHLAAAGHTRLGLTGYSMGGHMAAYAACHAGRPLAVVPAATGLSAEPIYTEGALSRAVAWDRLGEAPRARLGALLRRIVETLPPLHADSRAVLVAARRDGFVFPEQVEALHARWPGSELRWVEGGHVTALVRDAAHIRRAMFDAMARLEAVC